MREMKASSACMQGKVANNIYLPIMYRGKPKDRWSIKILLEWTFFEVYFSFFPVLDWSFVFGGMDFSICGLKFCYLAGWNDVLAWFALILWLLAWSLCLILAFVDWSFVLQAVEWSCRRKACNMQVLLLLGLILSRYWDKDLVKLVLA